MNGKSRMLCLPLLIVFVLLFSSCKDKKISNLDVPRGADAPCTVIDDYDEYKNMIMNSTDNFVPDDFVVFDDSWGEFIDIVYNYCLLDDNSSEQICDYDYHYNMRNGTKAELSICTGLQDIIAFYSYGNHSEKIPSNRNDMREFGEGITGIYIYENIDYMYKDGRLILIGWKTDTHYFSLFYSNDEIDLADDEFESKILNLDTAVQAITERFGEPSPIVESEFQNRIDNGARVW